MEWGEFVSKAAKWLRDKTIEANAQGLLVGLSGGLDSAVTSYLIKKAMGTNHLALIMPCENRQEDIDDAYLIASALNLKTQEVNLNPIFETLKKQLPPGNQIAYANLKPRLRMTTLYFFANNLNYLVVGTGNKSELQVGYFTKYGDGGVDLLPLGNLYKTEVRSLAEYLGLPEKIIEKPPSAGLWEGQTDERELGITYAELDAVLNALEKGDIQGFDQEKIDLILEKMSKAKHKLSLPPVFKPD